MDDYNYRKYECGTEIRNEQDHELPDECPVCGANSNHVLEVQTAE